MGMHKGMCGRNEPNGPSSVQYLREYIEQKQAGLIPGDKQIPPKKKKLTFEEWFNDYTDCDIVEPFYLEIWKAAQENV